MTWEDSLLAPFIREILGGNHSSSQPNPTQLIMADYIEELLEKSGFRGKAAEKIKEMANILRSTGRYGLEAWVGKPAIVFWQTNHGKVDINCPIWAIIFPA